MKGLVSVARLLLEKQPPAVFCVRENEGESDKPARFASSLGLWCRWAA